MTPVAAAAALVMAIALVSIVEILHPSSDFSVPGHISLVYDFIHEQTMMKCEVLRLLVSEIIERKLPNIVNAAMHAVEYNVLRAHPKMVSTLVASLETSRSVCLTTKTVLARTCYFLVSMYLQINSSMLRALIIWEQIVVRSMTMVLATIEKMLA
ncbi:hypothetical protein KCU78_g1275, partial [Aureobasidium melanogenum]